VRRLGLLALLVAGCADTSAVSAFRRAGEPADVTAALSHAHGAAPGVTNASGRPRVYLVTAAPGSQIIAADLESGAQVWRQADSVGSRIAVARSGVVYARPDGTLVAREGASGRVLWTRDLPSGRKRSGYATDGDALYDVTFAAATPRQVELVRYDAAGGGVSWRQTLEGEAGAPAARGGLVALPRRSQFVSLIDGLTGKVMADILSREEAALFVRALPEGLFFGSKGVFLASGKTAAGARASGGYLQAKLPSFIRPTYERDMYRPEQEDYSAIDRNRLLWRVSSDGDRPAFSEGTVVAHSFRFFFALDAASGKLRWAYNQPRVDAVAAELTGRRVLFVASDGELGALDLATGQRVWRARVGQGDAIVRGATFDAEGWNPGTASVDPPQSLARTLASILWDPDRRFTDVKIYAIGELASLQGREVTAELLRALEATELPDLVVSKAIDALAQRHDPASVALYTEALKVHTDYAEDRHAPRVDVLARAVAATKARAALPALLEHLRLPETDPAAVRDIADATLLMGAREAVPAFQDYLLTYRADPALLKEPEPVMAAAEVLFKLGGPADRATLIYLADESRTIDPLRAYLQRALFNPDPAAGPAAK
jgi:outer membrane protein assembly factor BamB